MVNLPNLDSQLRYAEPLVAVGRVLPSRDPNQAVLAVIATALLSKGVLQAAAVRNLAMGREPEAAVPNVRSLLEAFGELHYLFDGDDPEQRARTAFRFALGELQAYLKKNGGDPCGLSRLEAEIADRDHSDPTAKEATTRSRNIWTPLGSAELINIALDKMLSPHTSGETSNVGRQLYKLLSWDEHHVMAAFQRIELHPDSAMRGTVKAFDAIEEPEIFLPIVAAFALGAMVRKYLECFPELRSKGGQGAIGSP